jgi:hypothetical protein
MTARPKNETWFALASKGVGAFLGLAATLWPAYGAQENAGAAIPDFSSNQVGWLAFGDEFFPMPTGPKPIAADPAHPFFGNQSRQQPTSRVSDITNPILQPWAAGEFPFTAQSRCWPGGVPGQLIFVFEPLYFIQTQSEVWMIWERDHHVRRVYLNRAHSANVTPSWFGESVGHYEGDTLVVDTIGLSDKSFVDNWRTPHTTKLHVVERYHKINDGRVLQAEVTVEDPGAYTAPWSAMQRWRLVNRGGIEEFICAENNTSYFGNDAYPMPEADKPDF